MDLHALEVFCKIVELKSFSRAAEAVLFTQPTCDPGPSVACAILGGVRAALLRGWGSGVGREAIRTADP